VTNATAEDLAQLWAALTRPTALIEAGVIVGCLALAWIVVRLMRGSAPREGSIWFGERIVDGVFFPVLALAFAFGAQVAVQLGWLGDLPRAVFRIAIPILMSLAVIRLVVRVLGASFPNARWAHRAEQSVSWLAWLAVVLWVTGVLPLLLEALDAVTWKIGGTPITLRNLLEGVLTAALVMVLALWMSAALEKRLLTGSGDDLSMRKIAANLVRVLLLFIGLMLALTAAGIDLTALGVLGGALGVGIGFGLQKIAANYVSGFVILAERSIRIGDMVRVDTFEGRITDIRTRYTVIRALNGRESVVPNEMLITQRVENSSLADPKVAISSPVQVAYGTDIRRLQGQIADVVGRVPRVLADPAPTCQLAAFAADGIDLNVLFWIADPENGQSNVRSDVNLALLDLLNAQGVEIPLPQRVMIQKPGVGAADSAPRSA
jgi:small-conductance mechanosensitive channel